MATLQASDAPTHAYTCNTCQVAYRNSDLQKGHMKSDWHRYNLKRKIASLPPISAEVFTDKVLQARAATAAEADKALFERVCNICERTYNSENAYANHMVSQRHKQRVYMAEHKTEPTEDAASSVMSSTFSLGRPVGQDNVDSEAEEEFQEVVEGLKKTALQDTATAPSPVKRPSNPRLSAQQDDETMSSDNEDGATTPVPSKPEPAYSLTSCLFCNYVSPTIPLNAHHMERFHGMFIPEKKYLVNLDGLLEYLQKVVFQQHTCIACKKVRNSAFAVQTHMRDKSHVSIPYTSMNEQLAIGDYYDFRSSYSDDGEDEDETMEDADQNGGAKLPFKPRYVKLALDSRGDESEEDEEWETDDDESLASEEITAIYDNDTKYERLDKHTHHSKVDPRHHHQADGWHSHAHKHNHAVFYDEYSLHLPSGKSVGHRAHNVYYRQNLQNYPTPAERAERSALEAEVNRTALAKAIEDSENPELERRLAAIQAMAGSGQQLSRNDAMSMIGLSERGQRTALRDRANAVSRANRMEAKERWKKNQKGNRTSRYTWHVGLGIED